MTHTFNYSKLRRDVQKSVHVSNEIVLCDVSGILNVYIVGAEAGLDHQSKEAGWPV